MSHTRGNTGCVRATVRLDHRKAPKTTNEYEGRRKETTMPVSDWRVDCFRRAFLRHAPECFAVMLAPAVATRLGQKYIGRRGAISDTMIAHHLHGAISLAAPAA